MIKHAFTIDVEDDLNIGMLDLFGIEGPPSEAVVRNTSRILDILKENNTLATFFILGEIASHFPQLLKEISSRGHEIGIHGYRHIQYFRISPKEAYRDLEKAKKLTEDIIGREVNGHRAPAFSIRPDTAWVLEMLINLGFKYDSSIFPCKVRRYGWPGVEKHVHSMQLSNGSSIIEAPMSTVKILGKEMPACGGGYLRHFPLFYNQWCMRKIGASRPVIVYLHPYEINLDKPPDYFQTRFNSSSKKIKMALRLRMRSRRTVEKKIRGLLAEHEFTTLQDIIDNYPSHIQSIKYNIN